MSMDSKVFIMRGDRLSGMTMFRTNTKSLPSTHAKASITNNSLTLTKMKLSIVTSNTNHLTATIRCLSSKFLTVSTSKVQ